MIYTTNAIESLFSQMLEEHRQPEGISQGRRGDPNPILDIRNFSNRWSRCQGWEKVMNQLVVIFGDRLKPQVVDGGCKTNCVSDVLW